MVSDMSPLEASWSANFFFPLADPRAKDDHNSDDVRTRDSNFLLVS